MPRELALDVSRRPGVETRDPEIQETVAKLACGWGGRWRVLARDRQVTRVRPAFTRDRQRHGRPWLAGEPARRLPEREPAGLEPVDLDDAVARLDPRARGR